jgi:hypothetical protein
VCAQTANPNNSRERLKERWVILRDYFTNYPTTLESWEKNKRIHLIRTDHLKEVLWSNIKEHLDSILSGQNNPRYLLSPSPKLLKILKMVENLKDALTPKAGVSKLLCDWEDVGVDIKQIQDSFLLCILIWCLHISFHLGVLLGIQDEDYELKKLKYSLRRFSQQTPIDNYERGIRQLKIDRCTNEIKKREKDISEFVSFKNPPNRPVRTWLDLFLLYTEHIIKRKRRRARWKDIKKLFSYIFKGDLRLKERSIMNLEGELGLRKETEENYYTDRFRKLHRSLILKKWNKELIPRRGDSFLDEAFCDYVFKYTLPTQYSALLNDPDPPLKMGLTEKDIEEIKDHFGLAPVKLD